MPFPYPESAVQHHHSQRRAERLRPRRAVKGARFRFAWLALLTAFSASGAFAANFVVTATDVALPVIREDQRREVLQIVVGNPAADGPAVLRLTSLGLRFESAAGAGLTTFQASDLLASIEIFRDSNGSGSFEPAADAFVGVLYSPDLAADGGLNMNLADSDPAELQVPSGGSQKYFIVLQAAPSASTASPNAFRISHLGAGSGASTAADASSGAALTLTTPTDRTSKLITAAFNQPPTTTGLADVFAFDNTVSGTVPLLPAFHDAEDASNQLAYTIVGNTNPALFQFVGIEPATGNLLLRYAAGSTGTSLLTIQARDTLGKTVTAPLQVKVVPFITFSDFLTVHPDAGGPLNRSLGNGQMNLLSYAFFLNQGANGGIAGLPRMLGTGNDRVFTHLRPKSTSDVLYSYQLSQDMATWVPAVKNVDYYENTRNQGDGSVRVELLLLGSYQKAFMRVQTQMLTPPPAPGAPLPPPPSGGGAAEWVGSAAGLSGGVALPPPPVAGNPIHQSAVFPSQTALTTSQAYASSVFIVDMDNDGFKDVIAASQNDNTVAWYHNNHDGTFGGKQVITSTAFGAIAVRAADLDNDGLVDVVSSSLNDGQVVWYKCLSIGVYGPAQILSNGSQFPTSLEIVDINNDGKPDILWTSWLGSKVSWLRNMGGGSFAASQAIVTQTIAPWSAVAADLDGDGLRDIVTASQNSHSVEWYKGNGDGTAGAKHILIMDNVEVQSPVAVAVADLDGDGLPDVIAGYEATNKIVWFRNTGSGTFSGQQTIATGVLAVFSVTAADVNGDGRIDILSASINDSKIAWYRNLGGGNFGNPAQNQIVISSSAAGAYSVTSGDLNQDGMTDVVSASQDDSKVAAYVNRGGQTGVTTTDVAPASILEGQKREMLRVDIASRGIAGDDTARLASISLLLESSPGVPLTTSQANALIENLYICADTNNSGSYEPDIDAPVAVLPYLSLNAGKLTVPVRDSAVGVQIAPGTTRGFFVVPQFTANAAGVSPNTLRITHFNTGPARSTAKDSATNTLLTVEETALPSAASSVTAAQINHAPTTIRLPNITVHDTATPSIIAVQNYFHDDEDNASDLRYAVTGNSNPGLFSFVGLDAGGILTIKYRPGIGGISDITVQATDLQGKSVSAISQVAVLLADTLGHWSSLNGGGDLMGYAFGLNPRAGGDVAGLPRIRIQGKARIVSHLKPAWATDLTYQYEVSQDMVAWIPAIKGIHYHEFTNDLPNALRRSDLVLLVNWPKAFMRVRAVLAN